MKKIKYTIAVLATMLLFTGCAYFEVENKTAIDYRYTGEYTTYESDDKSTHSYHHDEKFEILWEYTYADGHTERRWEECTRFEYQNTKNELGVIEP